MGSENQRNSEQEIWATLLQIDEALVQKKAAVFEELLSPDFIGAVPTGASFSREAYIKHHCDSRFGVTRLENNSSGGTLRLYDNTAIINRTVHAYFQLPTGVIMEYDVQRIEVLAKIGGQWKMIGGQGTQVMR